MHRDQQPRERHNRWIACRGGFRVRFRVCSCGGSGSRWRFQARGEFRPFCVELRAKPLLRAAARAEPAKARLNLAACRGLTLELLAVLSLFTRSG